MDYGKVAQQAARAGGKVALQYFRKELEVQTKTEFSAQGQIQRDVFTRADVETEQEIRKVLQRYYPDHRIVGEEKGAQGNGEYTWYIDPIDGTDNFVSGNPTWGVSVGLAHNGEPIAGAIYFPMEKTMYWAQKGRGAWRNGQRLRTKGTARLSEALVIVSSYMKGEENIRRNIEIIQKMAPRCRCIRMYGSAVKNFAMIAEGTADAMVKMYLWAWDVCAGAVLVREAGGEVFLPDGMDWQASNGPVRAACSRELKKELIDR